MPPASSRFSDSTPLPMGEPSDDGSCCQIRTQDGSPADRYFKICQTYILTGIALLGTEIMRNTGIWTSPPYTRPSFIFRRFWQSYWFDENCRKQTFHQSFSGFQSIIRIFLLLPPSISLSYSKVPPRVFSMKKNIETSRPISWQRTNKFKLFL